MGCIDKIKDISHRLMNESSFREPAGMAWTKDKLSALSASERAQLYATRALTPVLGVRDTERKFLERGNEDHAVTKDIGQV